MTYPPPNQPSPVPGAVPVYVESSKATLALVFSIFGLLCCGILAPISWIIAQGEISGIEAGRRSPYGLSSAKAARVMGIIGTSLWVLSFAVFFILPMFFAAFSV